MAKSTRKKKEEVVPEVEQPIVSQPEEVKPEPEIKGVITEEGEVVELPQEPAKEPEPVKPVEQPTPVVISDDLTMEQKLVKFLESRPGGFVKVNDFLKSLFPPPKIMNQPPEWTKQGASKRLRVMLDNMQSHGLLRVKDNRHSRLGTNYYPDDTTMKAEYHNLNTVTIECSL